MEEIHISSTSKKERYRELLLQLGALIDAESSLIAILANVAAALKQSFGFFWVGFYVVEGNELVLGPFQGKVACTRIGFGKGVCGTAWERRETIIVPNVHAFPGHIACSSASESEIVIPIFNGGSVIAVLDVDSDVLDDFDLHDRHGLESIAELIAPKFG